MGYQYQHTPTQGSGNIMKDRKKEGKSQGWGGILWTAISRHGITTTLKTSISTYPTQGWETSLKRGNKKAKTQGWGWLFWSAISRHGITTISVNLL